MMLMFFSVSGEIGFIVLSHNHQDGTALYMFCLIGKQFELLLTVRKCLKVPF